MIKHSEYIAKRFYQKSTFYIGIVLPYMALIIDMLHNELIHVSTVSQPYTVLLTKGVGLLTAVYVAFEKYEKAQIFQAPAPQQSAPTAPLDASGIQG